MSSLKTKNFLTALQSRNEKVTEASYRVSYHTALAGEVHTIAER